MFAAAAQLLHCCEVRASASRIPTALLRMRVESLRLEIEKGWWQPLLKILQDSFGVVPKAALQTKEKEALKKAFGGFNTGFEQVMRCGGDDFWCHPMLFGIFSLDSSDREVIRLIQVFAELKQMTIPSLALRSDVVTAIADEVVRSTCWCQSSSVMPACRSRSTRCFTTDMPTWTFRRRETRQPLETSHLLHFFVVLLFFI